MRGATDNERWDLRRRTSSANRRPSAVLLYGSSTLQQVTEKIFCLSLRATRSKLVVENFKALRGCFVAKTLLAMTIEDFFSER